jgi:hypothetical protein
MMTFLQLISRRNRTKILSPKIKKSLLTNQIRTSEIFAFGSIPAHGAIFAAIAETLNAIIDSSPLPPAGFFESGGTSTRTLTS